MCGTAGQMEEVAIERVVSVMESLSVDGSYTGRLILWVGLMQA